MKTRLPFALVAVLALVVSSCGKDDKVELDKITGTWYWDTTYPHDIMDAGEELTFFEDGTYSQRGYGMDVPADNVTTGKYVISIMGSPRVLTMYVEQLAVRQYNIMRLDSKQMVLESTDDGTRYRYLREM